MASPVAVATRTDAMKPSDLACVVIDTTVQPKAVMFPTDAKLLNRARERLVRLAKKLGVSLRQSYARVRKLALIKHQRYAHAHQFKRAGLHRQAGPAAAADAANGGADDPQAHLRPFRRGSVRSLGGGSVLPAARPFSNMRWCLTVRR